jgi:transcriptional antiterminator RfaH
MPIDWLVVMTKPRQEVKAATHLGEQSFEVYLPQISKRDGLGRVVGEEPRFPGYCFCCVEYGQSTSRIRSTPGVLALVKFGLRTSYLSASAIARVRIAESALNLSAADYQLSPGDKVEIIKGPLAGLEGFASHVKTDRIEVLMVLMEQPQRIKFRLSQLLKR